MYTDPGSGLLFIQILVVAAGSFGYRLRSRLKRLLGFLTVTRRMRSGRDGYSVAAALRTSRRNSA